MVVVHDLRVPLDEQLLRHVARLGQRIHVRVTVVVVTRVLFVQARNRRGGALELVALLHVPVRDELHAVRIGVRHENDHVVQDAHGFVVVAAGELPERLHELLRPENFGGVQTAVDPEHHLAFLGHGGRGGRIHALGPGELRGDFLVAGELLVVLRARHDGHDLRPAFFRETDRVQRHTVAFLRDGGEPLVELRVVRQLVVGADLVAEELFRRGALLCFGGEREGGGHEQGGGPAAHTTQAMHRGHLRHAGGRVESMQKQPSSAAGPSGTGGGGRVPEGLRCGRGWRWVRSSHASPDVVYSPDHGPFTPLSTTR